MKVDFCRMKTFTNDKQHTSVTDKNNFCFFFLELQKEKKKSLLLREKEIPNDVRFGKRENILRKKIFAHILLE